MSKVQFFVAFALALGFSQGCTPSHALVTPTTATSQGDGATRVAAVRSPYQQCVEEYALQGDLAAPGQVQATDDQGNPVTVLQANGLALDQRAVQQICLRRARLETEPQPQTCTQWGRGAPSWCWRLANAALLSYFGLTTRPSNGAFLLFIRLTK